MKNIFFENHTKCGGTASPTPYKIIIIERISLVKQSEKQKEVWN